MPTWDDVQQQMGEIPGAERFAKMRETQELPGLLAAGEKIEFISTATWHEGSLLLNGLLFATNRRLLFIEKGRFSAVKTAWRRYDQIGSCSVKAGLLLAKLVLGAEKDAPEILNMDKAQAAILAERVTARAGRSIVTTTAVEPQALLPAHPAAPEFDIDISSDVGSWCHTCGKAYNLRDNFCGNCGADVRVESVPQDETVSPFLLSPSKPIAGPVAFPRPQAAPTEATKKFPAATITVWRLMAHHEDGEKYAEWSRRERTIAIGWGGTGDLRNVRFSSEHDFRQQVIGAHPGSSPSSRANGAGSLWRLFSQMKEDDLVIVSAGGHRALTMWVTGPYYFDNTDVTHSYEHRRKAEPVPIDPNRLWEEAGGIAPGEGVRMTLVRCARRLSGAEIQALTL